MLKVITTKAEAPAGEATTIGATLDDLARDGARRMITAALQLEAAEYVTRCREARDEGGHALVVRNGTARPRPVTTGVGPVALAAPRVNDRRVVDGVRQKFRSVILPPYVRRSPRLESVLPLLYLHGLSSGDFREALPALLGPEAAGLSSSAILRLTKSWTAEYEAFRQGDLTERDYVYLGRPLAVSRRRRARPARTGRRVFRGWSDAQEGRRLISVKPQLLTIARLCGCPSP